MRQEVIDLIMTGEIVYDAGRYGSMQMCFVGPYQISMEYPVIRNMINEGRLIKLPGTVNRSGLIAEQYKIK